jgi:hypothetical protein
MLISCRQTTHSKQQKPVQPPHNAHSSSPAPSMSVLSVSMQCGQVIIMVRGSMVRIKVMLANAVGEIPFDGCKSFLLPITSFLTIHLLTADVGGFFGNPEPEMLVHWYVVGSFSPFFCTHVHIDTKCREPNLLEEPYKSLLRDILRLRHLMLPVWYTAFRETDENGVSILQCIFSFSVGQCD